MQESGADLQGDSAEFRQAAGAGRGGGGCSAAGGGSGGRGSRGLHQVQHQVSLPVIHHIQVTSRVDWIQKSVMLDGIMYDRSDLSIECRIYIMYGTVCTSCLV